MRPTTDFRHRRNMKQNSDKPAATAEADNSRTASDEAVVCKELLGIRVKNYIAFGVGIVCAVWITGRGEWITPHTKDALSDFDVIAFFGELASWLWIGGRAIWLLVRETVMPNDPDQRPADEK